jgi:cell division protein FtsB
MADRTTTGRTKTGRTKTGRTKTGRTSPGPRRRLPSSPRARKRRTVIFTIMIGLALVGFLFAFVYPTRTYLHQRGQIQSAEERLDLIQRETEELQRDTERLKGDAEVERIAREQYGLVRPGETPYVIVPETTPTTVAP